MTYYIFWHRQARVLLLLPYDNMCHSYAYLTTKWPFLQSLLLIDSTVVNREVEIVTSRQTKTHITATTNLPFTADDLIIYLIEHSKNKWNSSSFIYIIIYWESSYIYSYPYPSFDLKFGIRYSHGLCDKCNCQIAENKISLKIIFDQK